MTIVLDAGIARSTSFRSLVAALDDSDVIVYVEPRNLPPRLGGYLIQRVFAREPHRYLRLVVDRSAGRDRLIGVIAHELQHALEIATAREVRRTEDVESFFKRIGFRGTCPRLCYETFDAIAIGARVRQELGRAGIEEHPRFRPPETHRSTRADAASAGRTATTESDDGPEGAPGK